MKKKGNAKLFSWNFLLFNINYTYLKCLSA